MLSEQDRLAHIFIWRQGSTPDLEYVRQLLGVVNPDAVRAISGDDPPLKLFTIFGSWPQDVWARALLDMRATPSPDGTQWTDTTNYDLAGWQGADSRTGEQIFVVMAYRKANGPMRQPFRGAPAPAPSFSQATSTSSVPQVPYYPQYPTGPLAWPPQYPPSRAQYSQPSGPLDPAMLPYYARAYTMATGQLPNAAPTEPSPESYAPYYAGFPSRFFAGLIDLACVGVFEVGALLLFVWLAGDGGLHDFGSWLGMYWGFFCLGIIIFMAYHVLQWTLWGQTLGKSLMAIKVVDRQGDKPQLGRALLRVLSYFPGGFLLIALDPRHQALHDKIAETYVVPENPPAPVPVGLPGYGTRVPEGVPEASLTAQGQGPDVTPALGLANVAGPQSYEVVQFAPDTHAQSGRPQSEEERSVFREIASLDQNLRTVVVLPEPPETPTGEMSEGLATTPDLQGEFATGALNQQMLRQRTDRASSMERARELFRQSIEQMEQGVRRSERGYKIEPSVAHTAAQALQAALELVPNSVVYRYFLGVALRYSEGFEMAIREFRQVLDLDPNHYEARQQVAYGQRWHDAFAYPPWEWSPPVEPGMDLPEPILALLPSNNQPTTRLVLLREGNAKVVSVLSRTPHASWAVPLTEALPSHIDIVLSRTPAGPIIAFYIVVEDRPGDPYRGETFLNPHDPGGPTYDACQLGQNLLAQLARQDHMYLIFADEENRLLLSRRLALDPQTQVNINRCLYEVQTLPVQIMDPQRFHEAAEWHMEHFSLDQVK